MLNGQHEPWTNAMRFDQSTRMAKHRYADRFSIVRVETTEPIAEPVRKSSSVPALLVSVFMRPVVPAGYRLWVDGKSVPLGAIPARSANVVDLEAEPEMWPGRDIDYVLFHVRRTVIDDAVADLGYERIGGFRLAVGANDMVLAQIARNMLPFLGTASALQPLALDHLELVLGAHLVERYGEKQRRRSAARGRLAAWQQRRVEDLARANLDSNVRLADLASACELSPAHFARSFKATFGVTCHRWLTERRIEHAQQLLVDPKIPLVDVAIRSGFSDQATFTRIFHRIAGMPPGRWRRERRR